MKEKKIWFTTSPRHVGASRCILCHQEQCFFSRLLSGFITNFTDLGFWPLTLPSAASDAGADLSLR